MPTLSQLIKASYEINQLIAASEEITPELEIQIQLMAMAWRDKVDGYKFIMDKMNSDSEALKVIAHEYLTISKRLSSQAEWMKGCLKTYMEGKGKNILRGQNEDAILSPSDPSVEIFDESKIPDQFIRIERIPKKIEIKEALKAGELVPGAQLKSLGTKLRWKKHAKQIGDIHEIQT